jgi:ParB family transcriptional regulator, chromosome partitioning protein
MGRAAKRVEMIPIELISVPNPRTRNRRVHAEITDNIAAIGLKRPITVARRTAEDGRLSYEAVCGEGRFEAFRALGQAEIPAIVIEAPEADCMVMSLVENLARRKHHALDLMQDIGTLRQQGHSDQDIATKIGVTATWVNLIAGLLEKGEERLVAAVETGLIPIRFAGEIARCSDAEVQNGLAEAYARGEIKGKKLGVVRRLLEQRARRRKILPASPFGRRGGSTSMTAEQLIRVYKREADRQKLLVKKADFTQSRLLFVVEALKDLRNDEDFVELLRAEKLDNLPRWLGEALGSASAAKQ